MNKHPSSSRHVIVLILLLTLLPVTGFAHDSGEPHHPTVNAGAGQSAGVALDVSATFDKQGRLWLVTATDQHVRVQYSDDFGQSLSDPVRVNAEPEAIATGRENRPKIALGPQGQIYVAWSHPLGKRWATAVRFSRSLDGGKTFSSPITVHQDASVITHSFEALAVAGNGDVVLAWIDARDRARAKSAGKDWKGLSVYYSWSTDGGSSFHGDHKLLDHSCECCHIGVARGSDGRVVAMFRTATTDNVRDHSMASLVTDGRPIQPQRVTFSGWQVPACPEQGPQLAIGDDGTPHAVWYDAVHGPAIHYGQLDPGHAPRYRFKLGGAGASRPDVAVHGSHVRVVWNQIDVDGVQLMTRSSTDGGRHFGPPQMVARSAHAVDSPHLLVQDGRMYVAWNTTDGFRLISLQAP